MMDNLRYVAGAIGGALGVFLGGLDGFIYALLVFIAIDYITGVLAAARAKNLSSDIGFWGLVKKTIILMIVGVAHTLDVYVLGAGSTIRTAVLFFFIANEGISLLENTSKLGVPFPEKLTDILIQLKGDKAITPKEDKADE